jgi:hypothetical protein
MTTVMRGCREEVRFSCIYKSARKQIIKSAPENNAANHGGLKQAGTRFQEGSTPTEVLPAPAGA